MDALNELKQKFLTELVARLNMNNGDEPSDIIHEVAESHIPIYYFDLLSVARCDLWLAVEKPEIPAETAVQAISYNLYDYLVEL